MNIITILRLIVMILNLIVAGIDSESAISSIASSNGVSKELLKKYL